MLQCIYMRLVATPNACPCLTYFHFNTAGQLSSPDPYISRHCRTNILDILLMWPYPEYGWNICHWTFLFGQYDLYLQCIGKILQVDSTCVLMKTATWKTTFSSILNIIFHDTFFWNSISRNYNFKLEEFS